MYEIENLKYKDILDIDRIQIKEGLTCCIVGESGGGKSTFLKMLNKMLSPDSGRIIFKGKDLAGIDPISLRRKVAMLSQSATIYEGSIRDNMLIALKFAEEDPASDEKLKDLLEVVKLDVALDQSTENLSGGEKQRLVLARILLLDAEVLLLDEPSSGLDQETEHEVIGNLINYTRDKNKTIIMITHSRKVVQDYADQVIELKKGKVVENSLI